MKLLCHCGCGRELKRTRDKAGQPAGFSYVGTKHDKNKRFYDQACATKWEAQRKGPTLVSVNGHDPYTLVNTKAERMF